MAASAPPSSVKNPIDATREVAAHTSRLIQLELELRALQLKRKAAGVGIGAAFGVTALLLAPLLLLFLLAAATAALATAVQVWLAILIMTGVIVLLIGVLGALAARSIRKVMRGPEASPGTGHDV